MALCLTQTMSGSNYRGLGKITGTVARDDGAPITGVSIRAQMVGADGTIESASDDKGAWLVSGMAKGEWRVLFRAAGYRGVEARVTLTVELARIKPIAIVLQRS